MNRPFRFILLVILPFASSAVTHEGLVLIKNPELIIISGNDWTGWVYPEIEPPVSCHEGDIVRVTGEDIPSPYVRDASMRASSIEIIGHADLPDTVDVPGGSIANGSLAFHFVRTRGIVMSVTRGDTEWSWAALRSPTGDFGVSIHDSRYTHEELKNLVDAEVSVRGIVVYTWGDKRHLGAHLSLRGDNALVVLTPAPADPFDAAGLDKVRATHRQTIKGIVLATSPKSVMIDTDQFGTIRTMPAANSVIPAVGHTVTAAGFTQTDPVHLLLTETLFRDEGVHSTSSSGSHSPTTRRRSSGDQHGSVMSFCGTVHGIVTIPGGSDILSLDVDGSPFAVDITTVRKALTDVPQPGATVRVTGICVIEFENASPADAFPRRRSITVLPRTPDDIIILRNPPWWTPRRLFAAIGVILAGLLGAFAWVGALHRLAERRGRELFEERHARETERQSREIAEIRMRDRTRLAVELHDTISQTLTGATMQLGTAAQFASSSQDQILRHIDIATRTIDSCREELRNCIWDLRNNSLDVPDLNEAIRQTIQRHVGGTHLQIRFNIARSDLSDNTVHALMRIVRELATNAVRHGAAKTIRIAGALENGNLRFSVRDDGCGFDPEHRPGIAEGHFGLQGIEERVEELAGSLKIRSQPGKGTHISIRMRAS